MAQWLPFVALVMPLMRAELVNERSHSVPVGGQPQPGCALTLVHLAWLSLHVHLNYAHMPFA